MSLPKKMWSPKEDFLKSSNMHHFMQWVNNNYNINLNTYQDLWNWSTIETEDFWVSILKFYNLQYSGKFKEVISKSDLMYETKWFEGISMNYAEHVFSNETTLNPAIIFKSETKELREVSWEEFKDATAKLAKIGRAHV